MRTLALLLLVSPLFANDYDVLIRHARVIDGSGNPWFRADLAVKDGRIAAIGRLAAPLRKKRRGGVWGGEGVFFLAAGLVFAVTFLADAASLPNYITRTWQTDDGLPQSSVTAVVQTRDGYIWLGTRSGLARFDGVRFTIFDGSTTPEMQSPHVTCLFEDARGALWIGHETGEVTCYEAGKFRSVPVKAAWLGGKIFGIAADSAGALWLMNGAGELARIKDDLVIPPPPGRVGPRLALAGDSA